MSLFTKADAQGSDFVDMNNQLINDNITYRRQWEEDAKLVNLSYQGNKYPVQMQYADNRPLTLTSSPIRRKKGVEVFVNLVKRQYRVMANFLNNNEPEYVITGASSETQQEDEIKTREFLNFVFEGQSPKLHGEDDMNFWDSTMDDVIYWGLFRGIVWTMAYYTKDGGYQFKSYDPLDTYIDTSARKLTKIRKFLNTYTKTKDELRANYKVDAFGKEIDWDDTSTDRDQTLSPVKKCFLPEPVNPDTLLIREGWYLETMEDKSRCVYKVITTNSICLEKTKME